MYTFFLATVESLQAYAAEFQRYQLVNRMPLALAAAAMLVCFGLSWPTNAYKAYRAGTAGGTSWQFIALITVGYLCGIGAKVVSGSLNWVLAIYLLNLVFLGANWWVYFRNRRLDRERGTLERLAAEQ